MAEEALERPAVSSGPLEKQTALALSKNPSGPASGPGISTVWGISPETGEGVGGAQGEKWQSLAVSARRRAYRTGWGARESVHRTGDLPGG